MLLSEILSYVADRTGEKDGPGLTAIKRDVNNVLREIWMTEDIEGTLLEIDVLPDQQRIITLPWYVFQIKGVKRIVGEAQRLVTPRSAYMDFHYTQAPYEWRILGRGPLFKSFANPGPVTLKLRKPATEAFTVTVRAADDFGVDSTEEVPFSPGEREHTTTGSYVNIQALAKSGPTSTDVEVRDITNDIVSIIPSGQTEVWCMQIQIFDRNTIAQTYPCNGFTVLFKPWPPYLRNDTDTIIDTFGVVLQKAVTASRLGMRTDEAAMKRSDKFEGNANTLIRQTARKETEGYTIPIGLKASPFTSLWTVEL